MALSLCTHEKEKYHRLTGRSSFIKVSGAILGDGIPSSSSYWFCPPIPRRGEVSRAAGGQRTGLTFDALLTSLNDLFVGSCLTQDPENPDRIIKAARQRTFALHSHSILLSSMSTCSSTRCRARNLTRVGWCRMTLFREGISWACRLAVFASTHGRLISSSYTLFSITVPKHLYCLSDLNNAPGCARLVSFGR